MDKPLEKLEELEEAVQLATQADLAAVKEDDELRNFEELFNQLQLQKRLLLEADVRKRKNNLLKENADFKDPQELVGKIQQATVKNEENLQIHLVCQKALEVCQYSLALESAESVDQNAEKIEEELVRSSIEYISVCLKNLSDTHQVELIDQELKRVQAQLSQVQSDISQRKTNPEASAGTTSERIQKLEDQLDKFCGRYDFSRFVTQLLLMASEEDLNNPKIADLFIKCGKAVD